MQTPKLFLQSSFHQDIDVSMSVASCVNENQSSVMHGSVPNTSQMTSPDKSNSSKVDTRKPMSSATSAQGSTSKEKDLIPYWCDFCAETSSRLWLPTATDLPDSDLNSLSSLYKKTVESSWFSTTVLLNRQKNVSSPLIYCPSFITSLVVPTESVVIKTRRIRVLPTTTQRAILRQWFGANRYFYNEALNRDKTLSSEFAEANPGQKYKSEPWMNAGKVLTNNCPEWAEHVPYQIKKMAVNEFHQNLATNKKLVANKKRNKFEMRYKSRRNPSQCIDIPHSAISYNGIYPRKLGKLHFTEDFPNGEIRDSKFILDNGRYYLCLVYKTTITRVENQARRVVALDPGVRTFMTGFSEGGAFKLGEQAFARIARLCYHLDRLMSKMSSYDAKRRYRMRKAANRMRWKMKDLIDEMHWKSIRFLLDNYDLILLPSFETSQMSSRLNRRLSKKSVRNMLTLKHYQFKQRLKMKCHTEGVAFLEVNEAFTSKTASWTGEVQYKLGSATTITSGGVTVDRDINGARGIFLRALVDVPSLKNQRAWW